MGLAMEPLDRVWLSSYRLSVVTIPLYITVWPQFAIQTLTGVPIPQISPSHGGLGPLGITPVSLPDGISFCPVALTGCMSVTDGQTDAA